MAKKREIRIRERAYQIWEDEGRPEARALDHWLRAEGEIPRARARSTRASADEPVPVRRASSKSAGSKKATRSGAGASPRKPGSRSRPRAH